MRTLLQGGNVVSGTGWITEDILIEDGKIRALGEDLLAVQECQEDIKVVDVSGKSIFPGFIDAHTHFDLAVAGTVTADNFETGTKAALVGGTTTILDFATQYRGESLQQALDNWHKKADHPLMKK